jgi:hypothetical protein
MAERPIMDSDEALDFLREHGVVLESAKGAIPRLTDAIVRGQIRGSWWAHPHSRRIFRVLQAVADSDQTFVCRLVGGKVTFVHARVLPALVRLAERLPPERIARVRDVHTASGFHVNEVTPYPEWVSQELRERALALTEDEARHLLGVAASAI